MSSVQDRVELLKTKYKNDLANQDEEKLLKEAVEMIVGEKLQLQEGKKMGFEVEDSAVEAALRNIEKSNGLEEGQLEKMLESEGRSLESYKDHIRNQILVSKIRRFELDFSPSVPSLANLAMNGLVASFSALVAVNGTAEGIFLTQ